MASRTPSQPAGSQQLEQAADVEASRPSRQEEDVTSQREGTRPEARRDHAREHATNERPTSVHWAPRPCDLLADVTRRLRETARALERRDSGDSARGRREPQDRDGQADAGAQASGWRWSRTDSEDRESRSANVAAVSELSARGSTPGWAGDAKPDVRLPSPAASRPPPPSLGLPLSSPPSQPPSLGDRPSPAVPVSPQSPDSNPLRAHAWARDFATETLLVPGRYDLHLDMMTLEEEAQYLQEAGHSSRRPSTASLSRYRSCPQLRDASPTEGASSHEEASGPESEGNPAPATPDSRASDFDRDLDNDLDTAAPAWENHEQRGAWGRTWSRDSGSLDVRPPPHDELRARWDAMTLTSMNRLSPPPLAQPEDSHLDLDPDPEVSSDSRVRPRGLRGSDPRDKCRQWLQSLKLSRMDRLKSRSHVALPPW